MRREAAANCSNWRLEPLRWLTRCGGGAGKEGAPLGLEWWAPRLAQGE